MMLGCKGLTKKDYDRLCETHNKILKNNFYERILIIFDQNV